MLPGIIPLAVALLIGVVGGAVLFNFLLGSRIRALIPDATNMGESENSRLSEQLSSKSREVVRQQEEIQELEAELVEAGSRLERFKERCAELEERASRVASLENEMTSLSSEQTNTGSTEWLSSETLEAARHQEEIQELEAKLAEAGGQLERFKEQCAELEERASRVPSLENEITSLETRLQEGSTRESAFSLQAARVAELEERQQTDSIEIQRLNKEIADLREKWEESLANVEEQQEIIERFEVQKTELLTKRDQLLQEHEGLRTKLAELNAVLDAEREQTTEKLVLLERAKEQLSNTFNCLASGIFEDKSSAMTE